MRAKVNSLKNKLIIAVTVIIFLMMGSAFSAPTNNNAQIKVWSDIALISNTAVGLKGRSLSLDQGGLKKQLLNQLSGSTQLSRPSEESLGEIITIPLPKGGQIKVIAKPISVMAPELAEQFPEIQTWKVVGKDDEAVHGRIDFTTHGFHAMLVMPDGDTVYIEPDINSDKQQYLSFSKRSNRESFHTEFSCGVKDSDFSSVGQPNLKSQLLARSASEKIIYRLAVAATGEYTQFYGGTKSDAMSAIATTINRVNEIYEQDLGVEFRLIPQQADIIYTDPNTDPYTKNDIDAMLDENILNLSDSGDLSKSLYDVGHLLGAGDVGGLAGLGSVCSSTMKAAGVTGVPRPEHDAFNVDFVAHELGHQLGGTHTFNSFCGGGAQRSPLTAVEPGSGSTVMGYAGICGDNNLQPHTDPQFHAKSISQISDFVRNGLGSRCGFAQTQTNQNPEVSAGPDYTIPSLTPFILTAKGSDADGDTLSYTWEQADTGSASDLNVDTGDNAVFRSRPANISSVRYIPRLSDLFDNTVSDGERLIANNRLAKFVTTVRDGKGGVQTDEMVRGFYSTGELFQVSSHTNAETLSGGDSTRVRWQVADTDLDPINCQNVDIALLESNGNKVIINTSRNDGDEVVDIPNTINVMNNARMMVSCSNNTFFNISSGNLKILERTTSGDSDGSSGEGSGGGSLAYLLLPLFFITVFRKRLMK